MMEIIGFLIDYHVIEALPFLALILYLSFSKPIAKARQDQDRAHSNRTTSRTSEYYSTEIDEL